MITWRTSRWNIALVVALLSSGVGVLLQESTLLLLSIPAVVFAAYSHVATPPEPTLEIDRSIAEDEPSHGQAVDVTVTLRNTGDRPLSTVTVVDGVPRLLSVRDGSARHATALSPGDETTFSYAVVAKRGVHRFEPSTVSLRDLSGSVVVETTVAAETALACRSPIETLPLDRSVHRYAGATVTTDGGSGTEFSTVRSYRPGDPPGRIDWNRYARDGELATVAYREDRSRRIVLCLDARASCYRSSSTDEPHAVLYERAAARELLDAVSESNEPIGLAIFGPQWSWVAPGTGSHHVATVKRTLEDPDALPLEPVDGEDVRHANADDGRARTLRTQLERGTCVVLLSPLLDEFPLETARTLQADGHSVTVLSPDVTATGSLGTEMARLRRENRIDALRRTDVSVIDWDPETALETAICDGVRR